MLEKKYQVFVSATYEDLMDERREVLNGILEAGCFPASMEFFSAANRQPWDEIEKNIKDCDYVVVVSAGKYGSYFSDKDKTSYTEKEFDYARNLGKPILAFIHKKPDDVKQKSDGTPDKSYVEEPGSEKRKKLAKLHDKLRSERIIAMWTKGELRHEVYRALVKAKEDETDDSKGWIRAKESPLADPGKDKELKEMREKIIKLEADNARLNEFASSHEIGNIVQFGGYGWRVLDVKNNRALILCERIIGKRRYHLTDEGITWSECELRGYLNETFYNRFSLQDRVRIAKTKVKTGDNPWFGTVGGDTTDDRIFLLSIEEVVQYFGDSGQLENKIPINEWLIDDQYNSARIAYDEDDTASWWWLRSPGNGSLRAAGVRADGALGVYGYDVNGGTGGVRPALWLNPKSGNF